MKNRLLDAIAEDESFDLAWYNLGVTLLELDDKEMARSVFIRARREKPSRWESTYALATLPGDATARMLLCQQMLKVNPGPGAEAQAYDLEGKLFADQEELLLKQSKSSGSRPSKLADKLSELAVDRRRLRRGRRGAPCAGQSGRHGATETQYPWKRDINWPQPASLTWPILTRMTPSVKIRWLGVMRQQLQAQQDAVEGVLLGRLNFC